MTLEIDLRTPEYIASRRLLSPAFLKICSALLGCCLLGSVFYAALAYTDGLKRELASETAIVSELREEVAPLLELAEETALLRARFNLEQDLLQSLPSAQEYFTVVRQLASNHRLELKTLTVDREGNVYLKGWGRDMDNIALFSSALEDESCFFSSEVLSVHRSPKGGYFFELSAAGETGNGGGTE